MPVILTYDDGEYGYDCYLGTFSSPEKAYERAKLCGVGDVKVRDVAEEVDREPTGKPPETTPYSVYMAEDGTYIAEGFRSPHLYRPISISNLDSIPFVAHGVGQHKDIKDLHHVVVWAKDEEDAIKEANEFRIKRIAAGNGWPW